MLTLLATPAAVAVLVGEVLFWGLVVGGLAARYLLRAPRLGAALLAGTVLVDLGILVVAVVDVRSGGAATVVHGLAALYVGFSVVFGPSIIRWADQRAAHRWAGGPAPRRIPRRGPVRAAHEWRSFGRWLVAAVIAAALLGLVIVLAGPGADVAALQDWFGRLLVITGIWFLTGPVWHLGESGAADADDEQDRTRVPR
jgi:hypothetical protein